MIRLIPWYTLQMAVGDLIPLTSCEVSYQNFEASYDGITGVITDGESELIGATVVVKNTKIGTVSDIDGKFWLNTEDESLELVIEYVGYRSCYCVADRYRTININMGGR